MRPASKALLVATLVVGALAVGLGYWVRHRPIGAFLQLTDDRGHIDAAKVALRTPGSGPRVGVFADNLLMRVGDREEGGLTTPALWDGSKLELYRDDLDRGVSVGDSIGLISVRYRIRRAIFDTPGIQLDSSDDGTWGCALRPDGFRLGSGHGRLADRLQVGADRGVRVTPAALRIFHDWSMSVVTWPEDLFPARH